MRFNGKQAGKPTFHGVSGINVHIVGIPFHPLQREGQHHRTDIRESVSEIVVIYCHVFMRECCRGCEIEAAQCVGGWMFTKFCFVGSIMGMFLGILFGMFPLMKFTSASMRVMRSCS